MKKYILDSNLFYQTITASNHPDCGKLFLQNFEKCRKPMKQLIDRYQIMNKDILSVGSFFGFEEFHFLEAKNTLTCIDIDKQKIIEPILNVASINQSINQSILSILLEKLIL